MHKKFFLFIGLSCLIIFFSKIGLFSYFASLSYLNFDDTSRVVRSAGFKPPLNQFEEGDLLIHGRGLQGGMTLGYILSQALLMEGKYGLASRPYYDPTREGGDTYVSMRIRNERTTDVSYVTNPDWAVVLHNVFAENALENLKDDGIMMINLDLDNRIDQEVYQALTEELKPDQKLYVVPADEIAKNCGLVIGGVTFSNTAMAGAFVAVTGIVKMESLIEAIKEQLSELPQTAIEKNIKAAIAGYNYIVDKYGG